MSNKPRIISILREQKRQVQWLLLSPSHCEPEQKQVVQRLEKVQAKK